MQFALVTGAAKGIGRAIAVELAARKYGLLLIDIDSSGLNSLKPELEQRFGITVNVFATDLAQPDAAQKIFDWSLPYHHQLSILINNAAYGLNGAFSQLPLHDQLGIVDVNIKAVLGLCYHFVPVLQQQQNAYILNIGSNAGFQAVPYLNLYAASKAFIISFTRSLRYELRKTNINVTCVNPGSTDTNFVDRAGMGESIRKTAGRYNMTPEAVAKIAVQSLLAKKKEVITGFNTKLGIFLSWLVPNFLSEKFGANIFGRDDTKG